MSTLTASKTAQKSLWLALLGGFAVGMLLLGLFGFRQLYGIWCRLSGTQINPGQATTSESVPKGGDLGQRLKVHFEGSAMDGLPVRFYSEYETVEMDAHGEGRTIYHFTNLSDQTVTVRPVHSVSPEGAGKALQLRICFCFNNQVLGPGETKDFPVVFSFGPELDERTRNVTLRYTLFRHLPTTPASSEKKP